MSASLMTILVFGRCEDNMVKVSSKTLQNQTKIFATKIQTHSLPEFQESMTKIREKMFINSRAGRL